MSHKRKLDEVVDVAEQVQQTKRIKLDPELSAVKVKYSYIMHYNT